MARELNVGGGTRVVISGDTSAPSDCDMEYRVIEKDGSNNDLFEDPKKHHEDSPNFNQTVTAVCIATGTVVKTAETI